MELRETPDMGASAQADRATRQSPNPELHRVSAHGASVPCAEMSVTEFLWAIQSRFMDRAGIAPENAVGMALAALEMWEDSEGWAHLTLECANEIADTDMEHWDAD